MSKFLSGTLKKLLVGITGYTENKTVIQTTGKVGIGTTDAQQHSLFVVGSTNITGDTIVGGGLTAVGIGSFQSDVYIDNQLFVGGVNITGGASVGEDITTRNLKATGISTFVGITTVESTLFTNQLSVAGVSTFQGNVDLGDNDRLRFGDNQDLQIYSTGTNSDIRESGSGNLRLLGTNIVFKNSGETKTYANFNNSGAVELYYDGSKKFETLGIGATVTGTTFTDQLSVSGIATVNGLLDVNGGLTANEATVEDLTNDRIVIAGAGGRLEDSANLTFDGVTLNVVGHTEVDRLNATGVSTFANFVDINGPLDVDLQTELDDVNVSGIATIQNLDVQGDFDVYDTEAVFHNNVYIAGNLGIGGTSTFITAQDLQVYDRDIILGITTDSNGEDVSNDTTANHGGVAVASTVGSPLVDLALTGFSDLPPTYKQLMWVAANSYGVGTTDAWHFNYAVGIGSTLVPNGTRLAVKEIQITDDTIKTPNLNVTGVGTIAILNAPSITPDGTDFGTSGYFPRADGSGSWAWADVPGLFSVNNILNGFNVSDEGLLVGTAGSITQLDFRGANIVATADPQPNGIATITMSDSPTFDNLTVSGTTQTQQIIVTGVSTFQGAAGFGGNVTVTGVSTFVGVGTFNGDLYVGGDLYVRDDLVFDSFVAREINVTQSSNLQDLYVAGLSTFVGVATAQNTLFSKQLNVSGLSTFYDDVEILGSNKELYVQGKIRASNLHSNGTDLVIRGGGNTTAKPGFVLPNASGGDLQILGNTGGTGDIVVDTRNTGNIELKQNGNVKATIDSVGIAFTDNVQARFGTSQDLKIYHNSLDSWIQNTGSGNLKIAGDDVEILSAGGASKITATTGGSVDLYHNAVKRLETTGYGVTIYNDLRVGTGVTILGNSGIVSATAFYGDGSNLSNTGATLSAAAGTQRLVLTSLTSGTMVDAATDSDLTYDAVSDKLNVANIDITGITTLGGPVTAGSSEGVTGQYLRHVGTGVTWANFPTLRTTQTNVATDGQTAFSFTYNVDFLDVFVNGIKLTSSEYTATNGTQVVLDSPAFAGDIIEFHSYNTASTYGGGGGGGGGATLLGGLGDVTIGTLADDQLLQYNSVSGQWENISAATVVGAASSFATKTATSSTATAGQTTFSGTYTVGFVDVYLNGAKLSEDQYTATSGTNIVLDEGASENDIVEVVGLTANVPGSGGGGGGITDIVNDTTPQLGGNLDLNGKDITGTGSIDITGNLDVTGISTLSNVVVGGATTEMVVDGDLRVTGIITTGTGSVTINGNTNEIIVGTGVTIYGNTGIISATEVASHSLQFTDNNATVAGTAGTAGQFKQIGGAPFYYDGSAWRELVLLEGTPVTTPADTDWDSVMLRLDFEQDNFVIGDIENKKVWAGGLDQNPDLTAASGVELVTSPVKFGSKSLRITNPGWQTLGWANRISSTSDRLFDVEGGWTMEGWIYITTLPSNQGANSYSIFSNYNIIQNDPNTIMLGLEWNGSGSAGASGAFYNFYWKDGNNSNSNGASGYRLYTQSGAFLLNTWNHIALVRDASDSSMHFYFNGTESQYTNGVSATFTDPDIQWAGSSSYFSLGGTYINTTDARTFDGVIDDFRFSNTSRYTANFTAPTSALPVTGTTSTTYTPPNSKQGEIALGVSPTWTGTTGVTASQVGSGHYRLTFSSAYANTTAYTVTTNAMDYTPGTSLVGVGVTRVNSNTCDFIVSRVSDGAAVDTGSLAVNIYKK